MSAMNSMRRRYPALLMLVVGALLAALSFWALELTRRSATETQNKTTRSEPDYFVENFSYVKVAANGTAAYTISGQKLLHHPKDDSSTITLPLVKSFSALHPPMTLRAERALINSDHSQIHFYDQVKMVRPEARGSDELTVESDYMLALPNTDIVKSDKKVVIKLGNAILSGTGLIANNGLHQLTLQSKVSGSYPSPAKH